MSWEDALKFRPLHDRVVVKRIDADEKSAGGIIIPDTAKEKPSQGEVIAVGPGGRDESGRLIPIDVKVGDRVLFGKWSGTEVKIDGQETPDHKGVRHHGRTRRIGGQEEGCLTFADENQIKWSEFQWLPRKSNSQSMRATGCCMASTF
jgi:chaperonin GroES